MKRVCLFVLLFLASSIAEDCQPIVTLEELPNIKSFSKSGISRLFRGACPANNSPIDLDANKFVITESADGIEWTGSTAESPIEWKQIKPAEGLHTLIMVDMSGSQSGKFKDISDMMGSLSTAFDNVKAGSFSVGYFDGKDVSFEKAWVRKGSDATNMITSKLSNYKRLDNSTDFYGAMSKAIPHITQHLDKIVPLSEDGETSEYGNALLIIISNGRDRCGCSKKEIFNDPRIYYYPVMVGDNADNNTLSNFYPASQKAGILDANAVTESAARTQVFKDLIDYMKNTIHNSASGWTAMKYCSPRRGNPLGQIGKLFQYRVSYNNQPVLLSVNNTMINANNTINFNSSDHTIGYYSAETFKGGCRLSSGAAAVQAVILFVAVVVALLA